MKKSINQIRKKLAKVQVAHLQIHSFFWGDFFRAYKERELNYPLMCAFYPSGTLLKNQTQIQLTIVICDKIYKDYSNLNDVESDTLQNCRQIYNVLNSSATWQRIGRIDSCSVTKFIERGGDEVAGHTMTITFTIRDNSGICDLPMVGYDFDQIVESGCAGVDFYVNGLFIETLPSGSIYDYISTCADATIENSDATYTANVASGGNLVLPDETYEIYVNGVFDSSVTLPTLGTNTLNITA